MSKDTMVAVPPAGTALTPDTIEAYLMAGRSTLVVHNTRTREYRAYQVWLGHRTQSFAIYHKDTYLGQLKYRKFFPNDAGRTLYPQETAGFAYVWKWITEGKGWPAHVLLMHEGRCGRCRRRLVDPESVSLGIGPECRKKGS